MSDERPGVRLDELNATIRARRERRERVIRAAVAWLDRADAAVEQDDELIELAKATRALVEAGDAP